LLAASPAVKEWYSTISGRKAVSTATNYLNQLSSYWDGSLSKKYPSIEAWLEEVRTQSQDKDARVTHAWAKELESYYLARKIAPATRNLMVAGVKSFLSFHVNLAGKYPFISATPDEEFEERQRRKNEKPLTREEVKRLVDSANTTYKAVFLTSVSAGLGVGEFLQFSREWHNYAEDIRRRKVPLKVSVVRPKTKVDYWTLIWDDGIDALANLLAERERKIGRKLTENDPLFLNQYGNPIKANDIQNTVRLIADRTGLDPKVKGKIIYRIRPHELRDYMKTACANSRIDNDISEFALGHEVDPLLYNKFAKTEEGEELIRRELAKARHRLNVVSGRIGVGATGTSYYEQTIEILAVTKGIDYPKLKEQLIFYARKLPTYPDYEAKNRDKEPLDIVRSMSKEDLFPAVLSLVKSLDVPAKPEEEEEMIPVDDYEKWKAQGWRFHSVVNSHRIIVRRAKT
jgi:integrase